MEHFFRDGQRRQTALKIFPVLVLLLAAGSACGIAAEGADPRVASESPLTDRFDFADGLYARDMYDMALAEYEGIIRDYPQSEKTFLARYRAAESLFLAGRYADSMPRYDEFIRLFPEKPEAEIARARIGEALYHLGRRRDALHRFERLFRAAAPRARQIARYYAGKILFEEGDDEAAALHFAEVRDAAGENPFWPFANFYLGEAALRRGDAAQAAEFFQKSIESGRGETAGAARFGMGKAFFLSGEYARAKSVFAELVRSGPVELKEDSFVNFLASLDRLGENKALAAAAEKEAPLVVKDAAKALEVKLLAAGALRRLGDTERSLALYQEVLASSPGALGAKAEIGIIETLLLRGNPLAALERIETARRDGSAPESTLLFLGARALARADRRQEAIGWFDELIRSFPRSEEWGRAVLAQAYLLEKSGRPFAALRGLKIFARRFPQDPLAPKARYDAILLEAKTGKTNRAIRDAEIFLMGNPNGELGAKTRLRLAGLYTGRKEYDAAEKQYQAFLDAGPAAAKREEARFLMGHNRQAQGDFAAAAAHYRRVDTDAAPRAIRYSTLKNRAFCALMLKDAAAAAADYDEIIAHFDENDLSPEAYFWLVDHHLKKQDPARARFILDRFALKPGAAAHRAETEYYAAEAALAEKDYAEAIRHYDLSLAEQGALQADAYLGKGRAILETGDRGNARASFEEALARAGDDQELAIRSRKELASLFYSDGNYAEAAKAYLAVGILYDDPELVPDALLAAGRSFELAEKPGEARKVYEELVSRFPSHKAALAARRNLKELGP